MEYLGQTNIGISTVAIDKRFGDCPLKKFSLSPVSPEQSFELLDVTPPLKWIDFWPFFQQIPLNQLALNMQSHGMSRNEIEDQISTLIVGEHGCGFSWTYFSEDPEFESFFIKYIDEFGMLAALYHDQDTSRSIQESKRFQFSDLAVAYGKNEYPPMYLSDGAVCFGQLGEVETMLKLIHKMAHAFLDRFHSYEATHHVMDRTHDDLFESLEELDDENPCTRNSRIAEF